MTDSIQHRLERARKNQADYRPSEAIVRQVRDVTFIALIGISAIGKSYLIPHIIRRGGGEFSELSNISTRAKRPSDPDSFRGGSSHEALLDRIEHREVISYVVHPSGDIYASDTNSYKTRFVLLPTLTTALEQLEALGCFKKVVPIGLVVEGETWKSRFKSKQNDPKLNARLDEAMICLEWLKTHSLDIPILNNQTGNEQQTADKIIGLLSDPLQPRPLESQQDSTPLLDELIAAVAEQRRLNGV